MKKNIYCLVAGSLLFNVTICLAQPILTASGINSRIGERGTFTNTSYVDPGNAGPNQTWDLTSMSGTLGDPSTVVSASSTSYGYKFPNANIAGSNPKTGQTTYFKTSEKALQFCGTATTATVLAYSDMEDLLRFPFAFTNSYNDSWATQFENGGNTFYRTGVSTVTADGYGTLITPNGTYADVMRVHFVQVYQDSTYIGYPYKISYKNDEYMWYKEGIHIQLAAVFTVTTSIGSPIKAGAYATGNVGIDDLPEWSNSLHLFPNPASDKVNLDFTSYNRQQVEVRLYNAVGQQVDVTQSKENALDLNRIQLDVAGLAEGIFFAQIVSDEKILASKRFIIRK